MRSQTKAPPVLPLEVARTIVESLSITDACNATMACKAFYHWASALSTVSACMTGTQHDTHRLASVLRFIARRRPLKVESLHLCFTRVEDLAARSERILGNMCKIIQLCSSITELSLQGLSLEHCFSELSVAGSARIDLKGTIRQCKLLTSLRITFDFAGEGGPPADASSLIMDLVAALPNLATLHWEEEPSTKSQPRHKQAFPVYTGEKAAESLAGSRLRLMQAEHCTFDAVAALPASLRIFSLWNGMGHHHKNYNRLDMLLAPCTALRELYILQCTLCRPASLDLSLIAACCPALRVVVLHVLREVGQEAVSLGNGDGFLSNLEVLLISYLGLKTCELALRAPALEVLALDLTRAPNITKVLLESAGARLQHLQLAVDVGPHDQPWYGFWRAVRTCTELVALQLVFVEEHPGDNGQQICRFLEAALVAGHLCLPKLASIAVYIDNLGEDELPELRVDDPTAPEDGAQGVCNMLGNLVTAGVLPALTQVLLFPCVNYSISNWGGGRGPQCRGAPGVEVTCRVSGPDAYDPPGFCVLRQPEGGTPVSEAALRAFSSLDSCMEPLHPIGEDVL